MAVQQAERGIIALEHGFIHMILRNFRRAQKCHKALDVSRS